MSKKTLSYLLRGVDRTMPLRNGVLGNTIRSHRLANNMTHEALAEAVGVSTIHIYHLESEESKPSIDLLFRLAEVLNMSLDDMLFNISPEEQAVRQEINALLAQCSEKELNIINGFIKLLLNNR